MQNSQSKSKTFGLSLDLLSGFSDELEKIASVGVADITKTVRNSLPVSKPKLISKPAKIDLETPSTTIDQIGSSRNIKPPPVTVGGP